MASFLHRGGLGQNLVFLFEICMHGLYTFLCVNVWFESFATVSISAYDTINVAICSSRNQDCTNISELSNMSESDEQNAEDLV